MKKSKRVILYGRSVLLGALCTSLNHFPDLEVVDLPSPLLDTDEIRNLNPDVIIYDMDAVDLGITESLKKTYPNITLIGINSATDQLLLGSGEEKHAFHILDLVNEIRGSGKNKRGNVKLDPPKRRLKFSLITLAWRNLFTHPGRTILSVIGISLGVAAVLATNITNHNVSATLDRLFERTLGGVELQVMPLEKNNTVKESVLEIVQRIPGVDLAVPLVKTTTILPHGGTGGSEDEMFAGKIDIGGLGIEVVGIDPIPEQKMRVYSLIEGEFPGEGEYRAVIPKTFSEQNNLKLGNNLVLYSPEGIVRLKVNGILADEGAATNNWGNVVFAPLDVVQEAFSLGKVYSEISVRTKPAIGNNPQALDELKFQISKKLEKYAQVIYPSGRADQIPRTSSAYRFSLNFFSILALFMGAFLIYNTFMTTVFERTQEIGILRAIGMFRRQIISQILIEAGFLTLLGCGLGLLLGVVLSRGLMNLMRGFFDVESVLPFTASDLLISVGVGIVGTLCATILPARKAAATSPVESLSIKSRADKKANPVLWKIGVGLIALSLLFVYFQISGSSKVVLLFWTITLVMMLIGAILTIPVTISALEPLNKRIAHLVFGEMGVIGAQNIQRVVIRTMVTIAALVTSLLMIIDVNALVFMVKEDVSGWLNNALGADLIIRSPVPMKLSFAKKLERIDGVQATSPTRLLHVRVGGQSKSPDREEWLYFTAIKPDEYRQIGDKEFVAGQKDEDAFWTQLQVENSLFISTVVADMYEIDQGDILTLRTRRGEEDFKVVAVTTEFDQDGFIVTGTYDELRRLFGEDGADLFLVKVASGFEIDQIAKQIKDRFEKSEGIQVQSSKVFRENVMKFYDRLTSLFNVLSWLGVIIGTVGLINTITMNILERKRELAMLRAQGCLRKQIAWIVLSEALIIGLVSAIYGVFFGYILSHCLVTAANMVSGYDLSFVFNGKPYLITLASALLISQLATFIPARRASRFIIIEALKQE